MRNLKIFLAMGLITLLVFGMGCSKKTSTITDKILEAKVTFVKGVVYVLREDSPEKVVLKVKDRILPNDVIITGPNSAVNVVIAKRGLFKVKENSSVSLKDLMKVDEENNIAKVKISAGKIILGLKKLKKNSVFEVETPTAVAGVRGTTFMVSVERKERSAFPYFVKVQKGENVITKVAVLSGKVELINPKNTKESYAITALKQATLKNDDFKNIKIEKITRLALDEISAIKDFSEIKELKLKEISEEIEESDNAMQELLKSELENKAKIREQQENLKSTEKSLEVQKIEAKKEAIKKMKTEKKSESKYLEDEQGW